jgi:hypothetical protein
MYLASVSLNLRDEGRLTEHDEELVQPFNQQAWLDHGKLWHKGKFVKPKSHWVTYSNYPSHPLL